jgi:hypothetical protein
MFAKFNFNNGFRKNTNDFNLLTKAMMILNLMVFCVIVAVVSYGSYKVYKMDWSHGLKGVIVTMWCGRSCS